jgi:transcription termination factor Rho
VTDIHEQTLPASDLAVAAVSGGAAAQASTDAPSKARAARSAKAGSLSSMLLPELQQVAGGLGISTSKLRKSELVAAIEAARSGSAPANGSRRAPKAAVSTASVSTATAPPVEAAAAVEAAPTVAPESAAERPPRGERPPREDRQNRQNNPNRQNGQNNSGQNNSGQNNSGQNNSGQNNSGQNAQPNGGQNSGGANNSFQSRQNSPNRQNAQNTGGGPNGQNNAGQNNANGANNVGDDDDDFDSNGRRRGRRYRDRRGRNRERVPGQVGGAANSDVEPTISDDDVLVPVAGIVDAIEDKNTWFVRTSGYFASPDDIYVSNSYVRRFGLRRGDAITGAVRQAKDGERKEKYNPLVRLDTINGRDPEQSKNRVEFTKLTPLYPQERLRLETEPHILTTRVIDLVMPIGKGQRALIVSPPKAGKTMVLQSIANAIATNNPEVHLMVVLIDERPEEVTDMQRSVKGEVVASTFDRRPQDHITVAELSIERAKRLVEMGHDVVVLLDSITRLGRAYNLGAPASGRILSGGVDSTALYPPKRFLGAARNIENGGSLTILATALVETGSAGDTVIFEEFKGTGNAELKLDRKIADKRIFPAVDVDQSSTRKEEILLSPDELAVTIKLRRVLHELESQQAINLLLDRLKKTRTNLEFLMQIAKTTPGQD